MSLAVRTRTPPLRLVEPLRIALRGAAGDQALYEPRSMDQLVSASLARQRLLLLLFAMFAGLALLLASIGIYGVLAWWAKQRVPEIGVRIAMGAGVRDVIALVLRQSLGMISAGIGSGILAALGAERVLKRLVEGIQGLDLTALALMIPLLAATALLAGYIPARRASRVDPMTALRQE